MKLNKKYETLISVAIVITAIAIVFIFIIDIGINSKYHISKSFTDTFQKRMSGDCDSFKNKVFSVYQKDWYNRCLKEKDRQNTVPIRFFEIKEISVSNKNAFLLVELSRDSGDGKKVINYVVNYQMIKLRGKWFLNQNIEER